MYSSHRDAALAIDTDADPVASGTPWSYTTLPLYDGTFTVTVRASDGQLSSSSSASQTFTVVAATVPEDAYTEEYADREGEIVKPPANSQFCLVEVDLTNKSKKPQTEAPQPGNIITPDGEFAPDSDLEIILDDYYAADDSPGHFIDNPVQPGEATKSFQLYSLAKDQVLQSVVFSDEEPQLELQTQ